MSDIINSEDMKIIRSLAAKYKLSVADFGRVISQQGNMNYGRQIRLSDDEFAIISSKAKSTGLAVGRYCELSCKKFLENFTPEKINPDLFKSNKLRSVRRNKRIRVSIINKRVEHELMQIATLYSISLSSLVRFCSLNIDLTD